jgi:hypothetical protein
MSNLSDTLAGLILLNDANNADINVTDLLQDAPLLRAMAAVKASQGGTVHKYMKEVTAASSQARAINTGIINTAGADEQVSVTCVLHDASFFRDVALASGYKGGKAAYIAFETQRALRAMFAGLEQNMLQGSAAITGTGFSGFPDQTTVDKADDTMVVNAGGAGGQSVWLLKTDPSSVAVVAGNEGSVEFSYDPETLVYIPTVASATPASQRGYMALAVALQAYFAVQYGNIFGLGRICNLDGTTGHTLTDDHLADALGKFPVGQTPNVVVMSRSARAQLQKSRTAYSPSGAPAMIPTDIEGIPILVSDHIKLNESTVANA